jgi:hypothetical protein
MGMRIRWGERRRWRIQAEERIGVLACMRLRLAELPEQGHDERDADEEGVRIRLPVTAEGGGVGPSGASWRNCVGWNSVWRKVWNSPRRTPSVPLLTGLTGRGVAAAGLQGPGVGSAERSVVPPKRSPPAAGSESSGSAAASRSQSRSADQLAARSTWSARLAWSAWSLNPLAPPGSPCMPTSSGHRAVRRSNEPVPSPASPASLLPASLLKRTVPPSATVRTVAPSVRGPAELAGLRRALHRAPLGA